MKEEIEQLDLQKQALARENRRLQDDLAAATKDCLTARRELDMDKQDVENLKKQLQQYVTEVKKAEELLTKKVSGFLVLFSRDAVFVMHPNVNCYLVTGVRKKSDARTLP